MLIMSHLISPSLYHIHKNPFICDPACTLHSGRRAQDFYLILMLEILELKLGLINGIILIFLMPPFVF